MTVESGQVSSMSTLHAYVKECLSWRISLKQSTENVYLGKTKQNKKSKKKKNTIRKLSTCLRQPEIASAWAEVHYGSGDTNVYIQVVLHDSAYTVVKKINTVVIFALFIWRTETNSITQAGYKWPYEMTNMKWPYKGNNHIKNKVNSPESSFKQTASYISYFNKHQCILQIAKNILH